MVDRCGDFILWSKNDLKCSLFNLLESHFICVGQCRERNAAISHNSLNHSFVQIHGGMGGECWPNIAQET